MSSKNRVLHSLWLGAISFADLSFPNSKCKSLRYRVSFYSIPLLSERLLLRSDLCGARSHSAKCRC